MSLVLKNKAASTAALPPATKTTIFVEDILADTHGVIRVKYPDGTLRTVQYEDYTGEDWGSVAAAADGTVDYGLITFSATSTLDFGLCVLGGEDWGTVTTEATTYLDFGGVAYLTNQQSIDWN